MEILFDLFFEIFGEFFIQLVLQLLADLGAHTIAAHRKAQAPSPVRSTIGHILLGAALGGLTLLLFPRSLLKSEGARLVNLLLAPLLAGAATALIGRRRRRKGKGKVVVPLDRFAYGFLLAMALAAVRYLGTR